MFAIYEVGGRSFRDSLEKLREIKRKPSPQRVDAFPIDVDEKFASPKNPKYAAACQTYRTSFPPSEREKVVHAHQIMASPVQTILSTETMLSAWRRLNAFGFHQIPVLNRKQQIVGMLSERDLLKHIILDDDKVLSRHNNAVEEIMISEVIAADPVTDVRRIASVMLEYGQSAVPITDEKDALLGIVSRSDILRITAKDPPLSLWT